MDTWNGFTSEDIKRLQPADVDEEIIPKNVKDYRVPVCNFKQNKLKNQKIMRKSDRENASWQVPLEARLSSVEDQEKIAVEDYSLPTSVQTSSTVCSSENQKLESADDSHLLEMGDARVSTVTILVNDDKSYEMIPLTENGNSEVDKNGESTGRCEQKAYVLDTSILRDHQKAALEIFQEKQKIMEEQNKRKKELLTQVIADRKKQTQCEAQKVLQVQEELAKLDALLSTDVRILRDQIEVAASEFNEAQKRYDKAESEFIEAKMVLFSKLERKEMLTEHLCRIIEANEQRKAKKLSELLAKLEVAEDKSSLPNGNSDHILSGAAGLDEASYTVCTTIKDPTKQNLESEKQNSETSLVSSSALRSSAAIQQINLVTAQSLSLRNETVPSYQNIL